MSRPLAPIPPQPSNDHQPVRKRSADASRTGSSRDAMKKSSWRLERERDASWSSKSRETARPSASNSVRSLFYMSPDTTTQPPPLSSPSTAAPVPSAVSEEVIDSVLQEHEKRRSNRVQHWLAEQRKLSTSLNARPSHPPPERSSMLMHSERTKPCNPYLAYPNLSRTPVREEEADETSTLHDYVIVEEELDDINEQPFHSNDHPMTGPTIQVSNYDFAPPSQPYATNYNASTTRIARTGSAPPEPPRRNFHLPMTLPLRPASTGGHLAPLLPSQQTSKISLFRRSPLPDAFRSGEPSTPKSTKAPPFPDLSTTPKGARYRLSSLTKSSYSSSPGKDSLNSPRPSTSTSSAGTSTAVDNAFNIDTTPSRFRSRFAISLSRSSKIGHAYVSNGHEHLGSPSKTSLVSAVPMASPSRSTFFSSTHTISTPSQPSGSDTASFLAPSSTKGFTLSKKRSQTIFKDLASNASSSALSINSRSSIFATGSRRKKLVVSGIAREDHQALEGLQRWCESFGEVRQITRMPNGDLHIDFRKAEVADTVCRISARVTIPGVGSVFLSWYSGKKRG